MPKISIILPTYRKNCQEELDNLANYDKYMDTNPFGEEFYELYHSYIKYGDFQSKHIIDPTLRSLYFQTFRDFEVILCHKYPEDLKVLEKVLKQYHPNLKVVKEKPSIWHSLGNYATVNSNRNTGILHATGELLFFLDDMAIFNENLLQTVWDNYQNGYYTTCKAIKRIKVVDGKIIGTPKINGDEEIEIPNIMTWTYGMSVSLKECLKINGFDECWDGSFGGTDMDFGRRLNQVSRFERKLGPTIYEFTHYAEQKNRKKIRDDEALRVICDQSPIPKHIRANSWKPTNEQMKQYEEYHLKNIGELDKNWNQLMNVPLYDMKLERDKLND